MGGRTDLLMGSSQRTGSAGPGWRRGGGQSPCCSRFQHEGAGWWRHGQNSALKYPVSADGKNQGRKRVSMVTRLALAPASPRSRSRRDNLRAPSPGQAVFREPPRPLRKGLPLRSHCRAEAPARLVSLTSRWAATGARVQAGSRYVLSSRTGTRHVTSRGPAPPARSRGARAPAAPTLPRLPPPRLSAPVARPRGLHITSRRRPASGETYPRWCRGAGSSKWCFRGTPTPRALSPHCRCRH